MAQSPHKGSSISITEIQTEQKPAAAASQGSERKARLFTRFSFEGRGKCQC